MQGRLGPTNPPEALDVPDDLSQDGLDHLLNEQNVSDLKKTMKKNQVLDWCEKKNTEESNFISLLAID